MKITLVILTLLAPFFAHAGGGGGLRPGMMSMVSGPEIVYHLGQQDGLVQFAHGQLIQNQWQITNVKMTLEDVANSPSVQLALQNSKSINNWAEVSK